MKYEKALELLAENGWLLLKLTQYKPCDIKYGVYENQCILIGEGMTALEAIEDAERFIHGESY